GGISGQIWMKRYDAETGADVAGGCQDPGRSCPGPNPPTITSISPNWVEVYPQQDQTLVGTVKTITGVVITGTNLNVAGLSLAMTGTDSGSGIVFSNIVATPTQITCDITFNVGVKAALRSLKVTTKDGYYWRNFNIKTRDYLVDYTHIPNNVIGLGVWYSPV